MIKLEKITKKYGDKTILNKISYSFMPGNIYVIKGVSGSGKTTLLNILSGIVLDYSGEYIIDSNVIQDFRKNHFVGYMTQASNLFSNMTVIENLMMVCCDKEKINYYAELFGVLSFLDKYPNELSGGERQRVALCRMLLVDNDLILADEPTASLDENNAKIIVKEFNKIKNFNKIIIISTHDNYFDEIADQIIYLDYGNVDKVVSKNNSKKFQKNCEPNFKEKKCEINFKEIDKKYVINKLKKSSSKKSFLVSTILLTLFLFILGFRFNFKNEYINLLKDKYPLNSFEVEKNTYEQVSDIIDLKLYDNYYYEFSNGIKSYILPDYCDSYFKNKENLIYGKFPVKNNEILVNLNLVNNFFPNVDAEKTIGMSITFDNKKFVISGIISSNEKIINLANDSNPYYSLSNKDYIMLVPYDYLKTFGEIKNSKVLFASTKNLYGNKSDVTKLKKLGVYLYWDNKIESSQSSINFLFNILILIIIFSSIIVLLFLSNEIMLQLHFRKKEIGYMQLFNIDKKRITKNIKKEYFFRYIKSLLFSCVLLFFINLLIKFIFNINLFPPLIILLLFIFIYLVYIYILIKLPVNKIMKKRIIDLIR